MKAAVIVAFVMILIALALAGRAMLRGGGGSRPGAMWRALAWRIGLSVLLILLVIAGIFTGVIKPHGIHG